MDRICGKCGTANESSTWDASEACPNCGAYYAKVDAHVAATAERARAETSRQAEEAAKREALRQFNAHRAQSAAVAAEKKRLDKTLICATCGTVGESKNAVRGSMGMEIVLWLLGLTVIMLPVAIVYSVWRSGSRHKVCKRCGGGQLIPVGTPAGRKLYENTTGSP